jgi:hypothetical protein
MKAIYQWCIQMLRGLREDVMAPVSDVSAVVGDFINRHMQNILVVNDAVDKRTSLHSAPVLEPRNELVIRYEPDTKRMFIVGGAFRKDCVAGQIHYKDVLVQLKARGVYTGAMNKRMSKGMKITSPGVHALVFDCSNPDFLDMDNLVAVSVDSADRADQL